MAKSFLRGPFEPLQYDTILDDMAIKVKEAISTPNEEYGWEKIPHQFEGIESYTKTIEGVAVPFLKCHTTLPVNCDIARRLLAHLEYRKLWDAKFEGYEIIEIFNPATLHCRTKFHAPWPVSSRDFSIIVQTRLIGEDESGYFIISKSIQSEKCPEQSGYVRGNVETFGYTLTPNSENPEHCDVIYCLTTDPCGSIPNLFLKKLNMSVTDMLHGFRTQIMTNPEKIKEISESFIQLYEDGVRKLEKSQD